MNLVTRRLRSLLIALAVLALSATVTLAGRTVLSVPHDQVATQNQGDEQTEASESPEPSESDAPDASEAPDAAKAPESPDPSETDSADGATGVHPDNHGKLVSEAAQGPTPAGFDNHGAYVRTIAQNNHGHSGDAAKQAKKHH